MASEPPMETTTTCFLCRLDKRVVSKENYLGSGMRVDSHKPRGQPSRRWSTQAYDDEDVLATHCSSVERHCSPKGQTHFHDAEVKQDLEMRYVGKPPP